MRATLDKLTPSISAVLARVADFCRSYDVLPILVTAYVCTFFFFYNDVIPRRIYYYVILPVAALVTLPFAGRAFRNSTILWATTAFLFFLGIALIVQPDPHLGRLLDHFRKSILILSFLIIIAYLACSLERFLSRFLPVIILAGATSALLNMLLFYPNLSFAHLFVTRFETLIGLPGYANSNSIGLTYAVLFVGAVATLVAGGLPNITRGLLAIAAVIFALAVIVTQSRSPLIAATFASLLVLFSPVSRRIKLLTLGGVFAVCAVMFSNAVLLRRMLDFSGTYRPEIWSKYLAMAAEHPWFGYGVWADIHIALNSGMVIIHPHNIVLSAQIRGGIFAALAMAVLLGSALYWAIRARLQSGVLLPLSLIVTVLVSGSVDHEILTTATAWPWITFWLPIAVCIAAELMTREAPSPTGART